MSPRTLASRRTDKVERGDSSELSRRIAATRARVEQEQIERGYGDSAQASLFTETALPFGEDGKEDENLPAPVESEPRAMPGVIANAEAKLTLSWKRHEQLINSGIDPSSARVQASERKLIYDLYDYERLADPQYYRQLQHEGKRPQ